MCIERRTENLRTQKVLSGRIIDPKIYEKPGMIELVEYVKYQGWLHFFEESTPMVFKNEVKEFYYTI